MTSFAFPTAALAALLIATPLAADETRSLPRADGSLIHYYLDLPPAPPLGLIVLGQGSGCNTARHNPNLATVRAAFPDYAAIIVEKAGIGGDVLPVQGYEDCPPEYFARHTVSSRTADYAAVISTLAPEPWWTGRIVLFGGSEGGGVMGILAAAVDADAAIMLSTGPGVAFGELVRSSVPQDAWASIDAGFAAARSDPDGLGIFAGQSHRYWADVVDRRIADDMLGADTAFLLLQGGRDASAPPAASRTAADLFRESGRCNLTYWEFPALDHGMLDPAESPHLPQISALSAQWVASTLAQPASDCSAPAAS